MRNLSINLKLGLSYVVLALLIVTCGVAAYYTTHNLASALHLVTGPVQNTSQAVSQGIQGVQLEMIAVEKALRLGSDAAEKELAQGAEMTKQAYQAVVDAGMLPKEHVQELSGDMKAFHETAQKLLEADKSYRAVYVDLQKNFGQTMDTLVNIEQFASQLIVNAEWNVDVDEDEDTGTQDSPEWAVTAATADARLALLTRMNQYRQILEDKKDTQLRKEAENALSDLDIYIEELIESEVLEGKTADHGEFKGQLFAETLKKLSTAHIDLFKRGIEIHAQLDEIRLVYRKDAEQLTALASRFDLDAKEGVKTEVEKANQIEIRAYLLVLGVVIIGLVVAILAYLVTRFNVIKPIRSVAESMREISQGEGDLTVRLNTNGKDEISALSHSFNEFVAKIQATVSDVAKSVSSLTVSTDSMKQLNNTAVDLINQQETETAQVSAAMTQMALSVDEVAQSSSKAMNAAQSAQSQASKGREVVNETTDSIQALAGQVATATVAMTELGEQSENIGTVLDVINGIAEQTNLLALNAAIEAARAGEQGRGFAVVADEVRNLASKTSEATDEIRELVSALQSKAKNASDMMSLSQDQAQATVANGEKTEQALGGIIEAVEEINGINQQIACATEEQAVTARNVSGNVEQINNAAHDIAETSSQTSDATEQLHALSGDLDALVHQFKV